MFEVPHGALCASLLAEVMAANIETLSGMDGKQPVLERYWEISRLLTGDPGAGEGDGTEWVRQQHPGQPAGPAG
ncbi:MAG: hypothetical protein A2Z16_09900 [Chloroflexi bacterium RBG_16_54_18]|nr:MAG: hypothetical protein A2Z16_09900 [Chloroflexi bacterium RBG_16_54_18]